MVARRTNRLWPPFRIVGARIGVWKPELSADRIRHHHESGAVVAIAIAIYQMQSMMHEFVQQRIGNELAALL